MSEVLANYFKRSDFLIYKANANSTWEKNGSHALFTIHSVPNQVNALFVVIRSAVLSFAASLLPAHGLLTIGSQQILVE